MRKIILLSILLLFIWAFFIEPNMLVVKTMNLYVPNLKGLKVVFVGDFHIKPNQKSRLEYVVKKINEQHPDLILSTGDFVSGHDPKQSLPIEEIAQELSKLESKYGFYTVLGNHDWWQGGEKIEKALEQNGIVVLGNENKKLNINGRTLYIAGVEDMDTRNIDLPKTLKNTNHPTILLTHTPDVFPFVADKSNSKITGKVDLTLAGHTHGGQVNLPFVGALVVPSSYGNKYAQGLIEENGKKMFVTKGIGTSILPVRFNCLPEIVVINFD
jgi:uncharacterized protein